MLSGIMNLGIGGLASYRMMKHYMSESRFHYFEVSNFYKNIESTAKLLSGYSRDDYYITAKFYEHFDIDKMYELLGLNYIDCLMIHAAKDKKDCSLIPIFESCKAAGKCKYIGVSFHGKPRGLEDILITYPSIDVVQLELTPVNYAEKKELYDICCKYDKRLIIMGAFRIGLLNGYTVSELIAHYKFLGASIFLSSPESIDELRDTLALLKTVDPEQIKTSETANKCINCNYCTMGCPAGISLSDFYNDFIQRKDAMGLYLKYRLNKCVSCGNCTKHCVNEIDLMSLITDIKAKVKRRLKDGNRNSENT